jgi:small ligand-binding sensory domain FIST
MSVPETSRAMACGCGLSTRADTADALAEALAQATSGLQGPADLAILLFSGEHVEAAETLARQARRQLAHAVVLGASAEGVIAGGRELDEPPALVVWLARWPGVQLVPMQLKFQRTPEGGVLEGWPDALMGPWPAGSFLLVLGDPFSFPAELLLERLNEDRPGVAAVGGMASAAPEPGGNRLILQDRVLDEGAVVLHVSGPVRLATLVSQGCRPIGRPLVVTRAERNILYELGGKPALAQLRELFQTLPTSEQRLVQRALHVGRVVSEYKDRFEQGDFLIRNVVGIDPSSGAIAVGDYFRPGQTVQFHVRDEEAADAELKQLLASAQQRLVQPPAGGLLFTCNGRGRRMFSHPDHDAAAVRRVWPDLPLAGFFAQGEVGPVGPHNFLHGFTASLALFLPGDGQV